MVLARHVARVRSRRTLFSGLARAVLVTVVAAVAALPLAAVWGIARADVDDYLGPHRVNFASSFSGEVEIDLGPIGNAYLTSPVRPIGLTITVGGVGSAAGTLNDLFSEQTLAAYAALYAEPEEAVAGIVERLEADAVQRAFLAEAVLVLAFGLFKLRGRLLAPWVVPHLTRRRTAAAYLVVLALIGGSILVPRDPEGVRIPVDLGAGSRFDAVTVDSVLLADLLDRGVKGIKLLTGRQEKAVDTYVRTSIASLAKQERRRPRPGPDETMIMGFSDLHCNQATTELIKILAGATEPSLIISSGDDTVNGTAVERGCIRREGQIAQGVPFLVSSGNHDSEVTEAQMKGAGMTVLDGSVVEAAEIDVLGDDDPEHNIPFSVERTKDRPETEEELGQRMVDVARGRQTDVITVHQPAASTVIMSTPNPPARLVLWGHFHSQSGPTVIMHDDGSWTVGMQQGTAGGVRQPTITSFSTPFSPPLISADVYFYFRDNTTGLITGVQPVHFEPDAKVAIDDRIPTRDLAELPEETRVKLGGAAAPSPTALPSGTPVASDVPSR